LGGWFVDVLGDFVVWDCDGDGFVCVVMWYGEVMVFLCDVVVGKFVFFLF